MGGAGGEVSEHPRKGGFRPMQPSRRLDFGLGLYVIGTEFHESPRIDLQLRGRSGRQGGVGWSADSYPWRTGHYLGSLNLNSDHLVLRRRTPPAESILKGKKWTNAWTSPKEAGSGR